MEALHAYLPVCLPGVYSRLQASHNILTSDTEAANNTGKATTLEEELRLYT